MIRQCQKCGKTFESGPGDWIAAGQCPLCDADSHYRRGVWLSKKGDHRRAIAEYNEAIRRAYVGG